MKIHIENLKMFWQYGDLYFNFAVKVAEIESILHIFVFYFNSLDKCYKLHKIYVMNSHTYL